MARSLRIEKFDAVYHLISVGTIVEIYLSMRVRT
jgi:hypothetical protein